MRASELLRSEVVDASGRSLGPVRDVHLRRLPDGAFEVRSLVIGGGRFAGAAHALGFAEGRAQGPWLLRRLMADAARKARVIAADDVLQWDAAPVRIRTNGEDLPPLAEARE